MVESPYSISDELREDQEGKITYVIDTSVLLSDPKALSKFEEHEVIVPLVVVTELEKKRTDFDLGYFSRNALRILEQLRIDNNGLSARIKTDAGGTILIDHEYDTRGLPTAMQDDSNDSYILATAMKYKHIRDTVVVVSKDLPMRVKASVVGLEAEEYRAEIRSNEEWSGISKVEISNDQLEEFFKHSGITLILEEELPVNTGVIFKAGTSSALAVYLGNDMFQEIDGTTELFGVHGRSAEQRIAISHLIAEDVGIVSLGGKAGTGKSALALLAGLEAVLEQRVYKKIMVFRPLYAVGGQELGFLPGDQDEKMNPWTQAVYDTLEPLVSENVMQEIIARDIIEVLPLTHIRGRSLHDSYVIVDEAQSLERNVLLTVLSRMGRNSKVILTHDVAQRDNLHVGRYDGIIAVIEALKGERLFAHTTLRKSERSAIAELVTRLLDF